MSPVLLLLLLMVQLLCTTTATGAIALARLPMHSLQDGVHHVPAVLQTVHLSAVDHLQDIGAHALIPLVNLAHPICSATAATVALVNSAAIAGVEACDSRREQRLQSEHVLLDGAHELLHFSSIELDGVFGSWSRVFHRPNGRFFFSMIDWWHFFFLFASFRGKLAYLNHIKFQCLNDEHIVERSHKRNENRI